MKTVMTQQSVFASLGLRSIAYVVDIAIAFLGLLAVQAVLYPVNPLVQNISTPSGGTLHTWVTITVTVPLILYFGIFWASTSGATPAMRIFGLCVTTPAGKRVSLARALTRAAVLLIPFEINHAVMFHPPIWADPTAAFRTGFFFVYALLFVYIVVAMTSAARQAPHDLIAGTVVRNSRVAA